MTNEEKIIKYLDNDFTPEERLAFERELERNSELREEFQKYLSISKEIEKLKNVQLNSVFIESILPEVHKRVQAGIKEKIRKGLSYAFGIMLIFIISIAVLRLFFNNKNSMNVEEFTHSLNNDQKIELLENLNGGSEEYEIVPDAELVDLLEAELEINTEVMESYNISYKEVISNLSETEVENIYQEINKIKFLEEASL